MMTRLLKLGTVAAGALAVALLGQPSFPTSPAGVRAQVGQRVEYRRPPPSCAQAIKDLGLEGQPVNCEDPPAPTYDPPRMHGQYRLYPGSYVGTLTYEDSPDTAPPGVVSDDVQAIKASSMYVGPAWLPDGYTLSSINTNDYDSEHVMAATYTGPGEPIDINHVRRTEWPVDIIQQVGDSPVVYETPVLDGVPAVLSYPKAGSPPQVRDTLLRFAQGDVETLIYGDDLGPETATQIALSLICGASCVQPPAPAATALNASPPHATSVASQQGDVSAPDSGTSVATMGTAFPTDHRVIAGLGVTDVQASYWGDPYNGYWHGWNQASPEAALDLVVPNGGQTAHQPVYAITWAWSGAGVLSFYTYDYSISTSCTGRYVSLKDSATNLLGTLAYVHLESMQPSGDSWTSNASGWTIRPLGYVAALQPDQPNKTHCPWGGPHLHQGMTTASPQIWYNDTGVPDSQGTINPTNPAPPSYNWMFRVAYTAPEDWDGDGCTNAKEWSVGFNPYNYWDVYDVPTPSRPDPTPNGVRDKAVSILDCLAVLNYVPSPPPGGTLNTPNANGVAYNSDKDFDGRVDGLDYDRNTSPAPNPPWDAGPPDSFISMLDVLASLKQYGLNCN